MNDNPLKQYFRRPAIYIKLPSQGKFYPQGTIEMTETGELPVYPMTAIDEITSKTPDALYNGSALVDVIKSCIPNIKDPWSIPVIDIDPILIGIKVASNGAEMDVTSTCPSCDTEGKYGINLVGLLSNLKSGNYDQEFVLDELKVKFLPINYKKVNEMNTVQFELERAMLNMSTIEDDNKKAEVQRETIRKLNDMGMDLLKNSIESISTPSVVVDNKEHILDFLRNCDRNTYEKLRNHAISLRKDSELKPIPVKCVHCSHDYKQMITLNAADFFD